MKTKIFGLSLIFAILFTIDSSAQAKRYALFEHFTQASCIPCAAQNPAFFARVDQNDHQTHLIAYHTWWPGSDPMYNENTADIRAIVPYYGVNAVPNTVLNGNLIGTPNQVTQNMIDQTGSAPLRIHVTETINDQDPNQRDVAINIETLGPVDASNLVLRVAVVEDLVEYASAPGSNGERDFPKVFRKFIGGGFNGETIVPAPIGDSLNFQYSYELEDHWISEDIYSVAYVADFVTKTVINSGQNDDANFEIGSAFDRKYTEVEPNGNTLAIRIEEMGMDTSSVIVTYSFDHPDDWSASLMLDGNEVMDGQNLQIIPGITELHLEVQAGETKSIGNFQVTVDQIGSPIVETMIFNLVSPVTDLIITNNSGFTNPNPPDIVAPFYTGLDFAENEAFMHLDEGTFMDALDNGALNGINNIYYSVGWTNEPLNNDLVYFFDEFLENGGNIMITGQDIGSYIMSGGIPAIQRFFYLRTMNILFDETGGPSNDLLTAAPGDPLFGDQDEGNILPVYGINNSSPDEITPKNGSHPIFYYNGDPDRIGGVRTKIDDYKIVYLGVGLEQLETDFANKIVETAHDWFYGVISSTDFDRTLFDNEARLSPNPATGYVEIINQDGLEKGSFLEIMDVNGRPLFRFECDAVNGVSIPVTDMPPGTYSYRFMDKKGMYRAQKLVIIR